jgi:hypothetical protein
MQRFVRLPSRYGPALLASYLLAISLTFSRGAYSDHALQFIVMACALLGWRFVVALQDGESPRVAAPQMVLGVAWIGAFGMVWNAWNDPQIVIYADIDWLTGRQMQAAALGLLVTYLPWLCTGWREPRWVRNGRFALFAAALLAAGFATIKVSPTPSIDVWTVQMHGAEALLHGHNPFTAVAVHDTAPGVVRDNVPYVYPPTQVYLTMAGRLAGDVRYTMLAAMLIAGICMRDIVRSAKLELPAFAEDAPVLFFWLAPKLFFILEQSWVDPVQFALIALALNAQVRGYRVLSTVLFGVVFSAKQTMFWVAPLAAFIFRWRLRDFVLAGAVAVAAILPFLIWDFKALKYANFDFLSGLPARDDALTVTNWAQRKFEITVPGSFPFLLSAVTVGLASWRMRGSAAKFGVALVTTYLFFFAFNKWAFANYYFLTSALAALAAAASCHDPRIARAPDVQAPGDA